MVIVRINVTGTVFEVDSDVFRSEQVTSLQGKLPRLVADAANIGSTLSLQRPVTSFAAILEYYQIGELHMPSDCCPATFKKEMDFWEIREPTLQECCRIKFRAFFEEQSLLRAFGQEIKSNLAGSVVTKSSSLRQRIWNIVDNRGTSVFAKIYFGVTLVAVITSILGITLGTDKCCTRESTVCEMTEYISLTDRDLFKLLKEHVDLSKCGKTMFNDDDIDLPPSVQITEDNRYYYIELGDLMPTPPLDNFPPETPPDNPPFDDSEDVTYKVRKQYLRDDGIRFIEYITLAFFTADWMLRISFCPSLLQFARSILTIIDFAALVGSYLSIAITTLDKNQKYQTNWIDMMDYIQVFRALRLFRLVKNIRTSQVLSFSIRHNMKNMSMLLIFLLIFICTFGTMVYFAEDGQNVNSILDGWWWSIVTLTTVGYGDVVPQTHIGRAVGSLCAITGIWLLSMTLPIFVNDFVILHHYPIYEDDDVKQEPEVAGKNVSDSQTKGIVQPMYDEKVKNAWTTRSDGDK